MADISTTAGYAAYTAAKADCIANPNNRAKLQAMEAAYKTCLQQMGDEAKHLLEAMNCCD